MKREKGWNRKVKKVMEKQNKRKKLEENILVMDCRKEMNKKKERINKNEECTTRGGVREGRGESKEGKENESFYTAVPEGPKFGLENYHNGNFCPY